MDIPELDPVIHAQARLKVIATLATLADGDRIAFSWLRETIAMTAGNLSVHLRKLEDAGYIDVIKTHQGRTPVTYVRLSRRGRLAFEEYTSAVRALLSASDSHAGDGSDAPDRGQKQPERGRDHAIPEGPLETT